MASPVPTLILDRSSSESCEALRLLAAISDSECRPRGRAQVLRSLGVSDSQLATRMLTVHNKADLLGEADGGGAEAGTGLEGAHGADAAHLPCASTHGDRAAAEAAEADVHETAATAAADHGRHSWPGRSWTSGSGGGGGGGDGSGAGPLLEPPIQVSAVTEQGLRQLLQEIDRKVGHTSFCQGNSCCSSGLFSASSLNHKILAHP